MSISNFITNLLQLEDENITYSEDFSKVRKKGVVYNVIKGTLSYSPSACPICGCVNENFSIIKYGLKSSDIKLLTCNGNPTILRLRKQRFLCKNCTHTFSAETNIVEPKCFISKQIKLKILADLMLKISEKDIAYFNYVSHSTVSRAIDKNFSQFEPDPNMLAQHLMFDEFKSTKDAKGAMSFIFADANTHQIIDIVENRKLPELRKYFYRYAKEARSNVETICIDMYSPYISLSNELFPNAKIVIDRFHMVQLLTRALQKARIEVMKKFNTKSMEYKRLKTYWKLILKNAADLNSTNFQRRIHFKHWVSDKTIVRESLKVDKRLENTYMAYQDLLSDISRKDIKALESDLRKWAKEDIDSNMKTAINTLISYSKYIANSLTYEYSNGPIEGLNNYIKVLKRIAFGYKSFVHFRNRILISKNLIAPIEKYQVA